MADKITYDEIITLLKNEFETEKIKADAAFRRGYNALALEHVSASRTIEKLIKKIARANNKEVYV